jgi:hypothetical protein
MAQILRFLPPSDLFDRNAVEALIKAYDMALASLHNAGQRELVRELIAKHIVKAARKGESDPAQLCAVAVSAFNAKISR